MTSVTSQAQQYRMALSPGYRRGRSSSLCPILSFSGTSCLFISPSPMPHTFIYSAHCQSCQVYNRFNMQSLSCPDLREHLSTCHNFLRLSAARVQQNTGDVCDCTQTDLFLLSPPKSTHQVFLVSLCSR